MCLNISQDHHIETLDKDVKVAKQTRTLGNDIIKPKYHATYVITSEEPKTVKVRYTCGDEVGKGKQRQAGQ